VFCSLSEYYTPNSLDWMWLQPHGSCYVTTILFENVAEQVGFRLKQKSPTARHVPSASAAP
jgi:hypothetical protein